MNTVDYYQANKAARELNRIEIAIQDRLSVGQSIPWNQLKRLVASNTKAAVFSEAVANLTEVGIVEIIRPYVKQGRRPKVVLYKGYASDHPDYTEESWNAYLEWTTNRAKAIDAEQGNGPAIIDGEIQKPPPPHPIDDLSYSDWLAGKRA